MFFDGGAGASVDSLGFVLSTSRDAAYFSDSQGGFAANQGDVNFLPVGGGPAGFTMTFTNLEPIHFNGAGGSLLVDASSTPATNSLAISGGAADDITLVDGNGGFEDTTFQDFDTLIVRGGSGVETIDLQGVDAADTELDLIVLDADNLTNTDNSADTIRAQSTSGKVIEVRMLGGQGNDGFEVLQLPAGTINGIAGQVLVSPVAGPFMDEGVGTDSLIVSDIGDASADNVTITETTVEGLTGFAGNPDVDYRAIDNLTVTATTGINIFDILLNPGSDLDFVMVNGNSGNDTFLLDLNTGDDVTNAVAGLMSVTMNGDAGGDTFGQTPTNAPAQGTGLPALPPPPAPLPPPTFSPLVPFPGVNRGKIRPSQTTNIVIHGNADNHGSALPPSNNATAGNVYSPTFDLLNLDMSDNRPLAQSDDSFVVVSTASGVASTVIPIRARGFSGQLRHDRGDQPLRPGPADANRDGGTLRPHHRRRRHRPVQPDRHTQRLSHPRSTPSSSIWRPRPKWSSLAAAATTRSSRPTSPSRWRPMAKRATTTSPATPLTTSWSAAWETIACWAAHGANELWGDNLGEQDLNVGGLDQISGGAQVDIAYGGGGNDIINLGGGSDYAFGGWGNDSIDGMEGDDRLYGGEGDDTISGFTGNDLIAGNGGNDKLYGKDGHDVMIGGLGADMVTGDNGDDLLINGTATYSPPAGTDASTSAGDANDAAMLALLSDWVTNKPSLLGLLITPDDGSLDTLGGGLGNDRVRRGTTPLDTGDWEGLLP